MFSAIWLLTPSPSGELLERLLPLVWVVGRFALLSTVQPFLQLGVGQVARKQALRTGQVFLGSDDSG